jgi:GrpB-like predicted nucleotidyltransferase (UPF0157 family)
MIEEDDEKVSFLPDSSFRHKVYPLFEELKLDLQLIIPGGDIQHVGSTAIPGSLTKGDLDIQVRIAASQYQAAKACLCERYDINTGGFAADDAISFEDYSRDTPVGVHLTVIGGSCDSQFLFRDLLNSQEQLREAYNELKLSFEGKSMTSYRDAKAEFVERLLKKGR